MRWVSRHPIISTVFGLFVLLIVIAGIAGGGSSKKPPSLKTPSVASTPKSDTMPKNTPEHRRKRAHQAHRAPALSTTKSLPALPASKGLGATRAAFRRNNNTVAPPNPAGAPAGLAWYSIQTTSAQGRVTSYAVTEDAKPAMGNAERMSLVAGIDLPGPPAAIVKQNSTCVDYRDTQLLPLLGMQYAEASTLTGSTTATMQAVRSPGCS